jgi:hypothetical protein
MSIPRFPLSALAQASASRSPRSSRGPWGAARLGRSARRGAGREAGDVRDSAGMHCPRTPAETRGPSAQGCAEGADEGWPFFGLPFFGHAKKGRSGRPKDGPKALALRSERRSDEARPGQVCSSWWARAHPMTAGRSGRPKDGPKALALRFKQRSEQANPRRAWSSWWARAHPMPHAFPNPESRIPNPSSHIFTARPPSTRSTCPLVYCARSR